MKKILLVLVVTALFACSEKPATGTFGQAFEKKGAMDFKTALKDYQAGLDTTYIIQGTIDNVCSHSGCWITFKNEGSDFYVNTNEKFTMPKNSKGKTAIAKGKFVKDETGEISFEPTGVTIE